MKLKLLSWIRFLSLAAFLGISSYYMLNFQFQKNNLDVALGVTYKDVNELSRNAELIVVADIPSNYDVIAELHYYRKDLKIIHHMYDITIKKIIKNKTNQNIQKMVMLLE